MAKDAADTKIIEEQLLPFKIYGEEAKYQNWVEMSPSARSEDKKEKDKLKKLEKRLLVITKYRLLVFKKATFSSSRVLHKIVHLYDLLEINATDKSNVVDLLYSEKGNCTTRIKCDNLPLLLTTLRDLVRAITFGYSPDAMLKFLCIPSDVLPPPEYEQQAGIAGGFLEVYNAQCSYLRTRPSLEFQRYIHYLVHNNISDLDLSHCPGIDNKTEISVDIPTVFQSLKFNTYFKAIIVRNVQVRNIMDSLGQAFKHNTSISRVQIVNTQEDQSLVNLGHALKNNLGNVLQVLDLSHNTLSLESVNSLCAGLVGLTHALPVLNLAHCGITAKGVNSICSAFEANFGMSLSIQELDLSHNKFDEISSTTFVTWLGHIKGAYALRRLGLASTGIDLVIVGSVMRTLIEIHHLDLSGNKLDKPEVVSEIKTFIECSSELNSLLLSDCSLSPESVEEILLQFTNNKKLHDVSLDLSENNLGMKGATACARGMADCNYLRKSIAEILVTLNTNHSIQELYLGKNLQGPSDMEDLTKMLLDYISCHPNMNILDLSGSTAGKAIFPLLQALSTNTSLTSLDISGNQFGDLGASILTDSLATNATLTSLNLDQNGLTLGGWQSLCFALASNRTIRDIPIPTTELEKTVPKERQEQFRDLVARLTLYLQYNSGNSYPPGLPFALPCVTPYDTPTGLTPLAAVPGHLRNIPMTTKQETVLDVLNASTSPEFRKSTGSPLSSPDLSPEYKYVASPPRPRGTTLPSQSPPPPPPLNLASSELPPPVSPRLETPPPPPTFAPPPPLAPPPQLNTMPLHPTLHHQPPPPPMSQPPPPPERPQSFNHSYPAHPTLAPPPRTNMFAPPAMEDNYNNNHSPTNGNRPGPPPVPPPPSSSTRGAPAPPPPPPATAPPPPPPPMSSGGGGAKGGDKARSAVMNDITGFSKKGLKKTVTNDRSSPKV